MNIPDTPWGFLLQNLLNQHYPTSIDDIFTSVQSKIKCTNISCTECPYSIPGEDCVKTRINDHPKIINFIHKNLPELLL